MPPRGYLKLGLRDPKLSYGTYTKNGNELTGMNKEGMGTSLAHDAWGRMTSKTRGNYSATYAWGEGDKLTGVASSFPGEGSVTYAYGDGKRRERNDGSLTKYRWDRGWNVLHEENGSGGLTLSLVPGLADIAGSSPATGTIRYTLRDHLGSLRALYAPDKAGLGRQEYTPYGTDYLQAGARATRAYTGHDRDAATGLYFAPYRYYSPDLARWLSRDPLGMIDGPNLFGYVHAGPIQNADPLGLLPAVNWPSIFKYLTAGLGTFGLAATIAVYGHILKLCVDCYVRAAESVQQLMGTGMVDTAEEQRALRCADFGGECSDVCSELPSGVAGLVRQFFLKVPTL